MRSIKKVLSACAWAAPILAAVVPRDARTDVERPDGKLLELDLQKNYAQATFSVPCAGCLGSDHTSHDDESLILSFKTHAHEEACGAANITLNGVYLPQEWNGDSATGSGSYTGVTDVQENAWFLQHDLDLEWESACLRGEQEAEDDAQVITVNIKSLDGRPVENPTGFTISFKQQSPPELLRLETVPNRSASDKQNAESWREPPSHLRLIITPASFEEVKTVGGPSQSLLEDDIRELRALEAELQELQRTIKQKKKYIDSQLKNETQSFKEELQDCDSISCVVRTIAHKAHGTWRILYIRFRPNHFHHHRHPPSAPMGLPEDDTYMHSWRAGNYKQIPEGNVKVSSISPPPPHPPSPPHTASEDLPPPHSQSHGRPRIPPPDSPYVIALEIVLSLLCCGCFISIIRHRCSSLRTRTERAAAREEAANARAYRRAARSLAWRRFWTRSWRDQERIEDYEEKRSLIQHQESVLEDAMQDEIRQLRAAHSIVNDLVSAEEGRIRIGTPPTHIQCSCHHGRTRPRAPSSEAPYSPLSTASSYPSSSISELPSRPLSRTDSLPGYRSDASSSPPAYEEDEDTSDTVANGFRQYPISSASSTSSRWTPDSSVVDVSPRPSAETLRYAETTDTGVGEKS